MVQGPDGDLIAHCGTRLWATASPVEKPVETYIECSL